MTHQLLSQNVSDAKVSLRKVIANIANNVIRSETTVCQIRLTQGGDDIVIDSDTATTIALVINELIQNAIEYLLKDRTSFLIAHRLSTIRNADLILVVMNGKIVEQGTHTELLKKQGNYYRLYTRQYEDEATKGILS